MSRREIVAPLTGDISVVSRGDLHDQGIPALTYASWVTVLEPKLVQLCSLARRSYLRRLALIHFSCLAFSSSVSIS